MNKTYNKIVGYWIKPTCDFNVRKYKDGVYKKPIWIYRKIAKLLLGWEYKND